MKEAVKHIPGEMVNLFQYCVVCGMEICNYNGVMVHPADSKISGWQPYEPIYSLGNCTTNSIDENVYKVVPCNER